MVWVRAEISEMKQNRTGHCYLDLVEVDPATHEVKARVRATIWTYTFRMLKPYFETTTGQAFSDGINVLVQAKVEFHPVYGLSLNIRDIDPAYTMGDMARRRMTIVRRLETEGVLDMNKGLALPVVPQRIAVISSPTAAGLQDFFNQLNDNPHGFRFYTRLFPAVMQGKEAAASIRTALDLIFEYENFFDVVVLIRGGGAQLDLACFDDYDLAFYVTQFPLPVLTGIGHDKDESVVDMVAHTKLKTPTAVAEFLVSGALVFEQSLAEREKSLASLAGEILNTQNDFLRRAADRLKQGVGQLVRKAGHRSEIALLRMGNSLPVYLRNRNQQLISQQLSLQAKGQHLIQENSYQLKRQSDRLKYAIHRMVYQQKQKLNSSQEACLHQSRMLLQVQWRRLDTADGKMKLVDPAAVLGRGYSLTYSNGRLVKSVGDIAQNDEMKIYLKDGRLDGLVKNIKRNNDGKENDL